MIASWFCKRRRLVQSRALRSPPSVLLLFARRSIATAARSSAPGLRPSAVSGSARSRSTIARAVDAVSYGFVDRLSHRALERSAKKGIQNSNRAGASEIVNPGSVLSIDSPKCLSKIALIRGIKKYGMVSATYLTSVITSPSAACCDILLLARFRTPYPIISSQEK